MSKSGRSSENAATNLTNFSFCENKQKYEYLLLGSDKQTWILDDKSDFWKFVNKYEVMLRNVGQSKLCDALDETQWLETLPYHKQKHIPLRHASRETTAAADAKSKQFQEIVLLYIDFKQKEKFAKIKKLRQAQKSLPIWRYRTQLQQALSDSRVVILAGDTGCGKSTQVPQYLFEFGFNSVACTQPRRLACVSLAKRVSYEMMCPYGSKVGFQIRFEKHKTAATNILFITEGLLLRQFAEGTKLDRYDVVILDEIHERNLFGDFLLGVTKCLLRANPNCKLILMSATINVELFHDFFKEENAALITVPGRLFPIKTVFMPPPALEYKGGTKRSSNNANRLDPAPFVQILNLIDQKFSVTERGDVLMFVSGVNEITTVCDAAKEYAEQNSHWIILPLHSGLALAQQDKVFDYAPDGMRKCIVSTNIAETSLTVDGIRFVVDSGKVKEMSYDASCKGQRLKEFWVSKSSAEQRKGRAGRTGPGTCFRLFSEKQYEAFEPYPKPEIFRVPLETILLQMAAMGLPNVRAFPFIETPAEASIEQTILALKQHNALTAEEKLTALGKALSNLPVDVPIGKLLLMGCVFPDVEKILTIAAIMSIQNPFTNRAYTDHKCEQERSQYETDQGDIFTLLNAYHKWLKLKSYRENTKKWCHQLGIEEQRFYEVTKLRNQFQQILETSKLTCTNANAPALTSAERARRHGELRMLKASKRKQKFQEPQKRKILKISEHGEDECFDNANEDIRDIEFRLSHDSNKIQLLIDSSNVSKRRDVLLLKLIIVSGFYPQIAIADDFNYCKGGAQQFFHTFLKPFISIHPNSYFAKYFDVLKMNDSDFLEKPNYYTPKAMLSSKHQILCYQKLLETAKPYLMNSIRMPAAQTLLLFSYSIDTNATVTRIVCDSWLCLDFPILDSGCEFLYRAIKLRRLWNKLLSAKLNEVDNDDSSVVKKSNNADVDDLWNSLIDFMSIDISYTIKRLLPADLKSLYTGRIIDNSDAFIERNPFASDFLVTNNDEKGGLNVAENVVYGCLQETQWTIAMESQMKEHNWTCKYCELEMEMNIIEKFLHKSVCRKDNRSKRIPAADVAHSSKSTDQTNKSSCYKCEFCKMEIVPTNINILKHKKNCKGQ